MSLEDARRSALRARAHPLRLRMLSLLTGAAMSAAELARELGISQALASYHLRFLADADVVQLVEESVNRGGRERRYRYDPTAPEPGSAGIDLDTLELMLNAAVDELRRRHTERDDGGPGLTVDAELWVTEEDWKAARDAVHDATLLLHQRAARPHQPGTRRVNATVFMFPMTESASAEDKR
jgi:DNA-binding transcriptional ArsR family regulator